MFVLLSLTAVPVVAAAAGGDLRRSDTLDMRRAGKVSEDERAVLRIEWRAGLSGIDADRKMQEITTRLRQVEASVTTVGQLVRNMPSQKPASATTSRAAEEDGQAGVDWRLMAANVTALVLVIIWWLSRRKTQLAAAALEAEIAAKLRKEPETRMSAEPEPGNAGLGPNGDVSPGVADEATSGGMSGGMPMRDDPAASLPPASHPVFAASAPAAAAGGAMPAPSDPAGDSHPDDPSALAAPLLVDFVLEEADPATVVSQAPRPVRKTTAAVTPEAVSASLNTNAEPTLQLAEIMLSMGLEQGAAQALMEYTEANPRDAIYHMLKLLGIYRKRGLHKEFQETAEKLRKNFNIQAEDWARTESGETPSLEKFSRVAQHVQSIWQDPKECIGYLRRLLEDNRDGARAGFPQSVAEEILLLVEILKETSGANQQAA